MTIDMRPTIIPKSDQLNSDDLITGPITIKVTKVSLCKEPEQPIAVNFEGDGGKPYKPGKSMRRVLVNIWGPDGAAYVGRSMTLYRDETVKFGGLDVGGIRISHLSNITRPVTMALTASRAARKPFTVQPLAAAKEEPKRRTVAEFLADTEARFAAAQSVAEVDALEAEDDVQKALGTFRNGGLEKLRGIIDGARARLAGAGEEDPELPRAQEIIASFEACDTLAAYDAINENPAIQMELRQWQRTDDKLALWNLVEDAKTAKLAALRGG